MYFQLVESQALSTQGQLDVFNLHRLTSETRTLKGMYFQLVESQVLSTQGQPDVFNLRRLYLELLLGPRRAVVYAPRCKCASSRQTRGFKLKALFYPFHNQSLKPGGAFKL